MPPDPPIIHVLMHIYTGLRSPSFPQILISPPLDQFLNEGLVSDISIENMVKGFHCVWEHKGQNSQGT